jgi:hypothetical protein
MRTFIRIGIDLANNFFQVHAIEREDEPAVTRLVEPRQGACVLRPSGALPRRDGGLWIIPLLGARDPGFGARRGLDSSRLHETLKRGKNDANDAAAIWRSSSPRAWAVRCSTLTAPPR